jgi:hypothetical protein
MCGVVLSEFRFPRWRLIGALAMLGPILGGCSSPSMSSLFGSKTPATDASASAAPALTLPSNFECPAVQIRPGAATLSSSSNPAEPTAMNLRYQVTIGTTARECRLLPGNVVAMKVGVQGRVILGPDGNDGVVNVPLRFAVVHELIDSQVITTKLDRIAVTVPPNDANVLFTHVAEGLEFPMPKGAEIDSYVVYIGFDPTGLEPERKKPAPKPRPAKSSRVSG